MKQLPFNITMIHPACRDRFTRLIANLEQDKTMPVLFKPFEGYRSPERQEYCFKKGTSKAHAWHSSHQYGIAVDFVPWVNEQWTWDVPKSAWAALKSRAEAHGLFVPISWDSPHVEDAALWAKIKAAL